MAKVKRLCKHSEPFSVCKKCRADYDRAYRLKRRKAYKAWLTERGCSCCGEAHAGCLEVHHLEKNGKRYGNVSRGQASMYNVQDVEKEIAIILCANCHLIFHNSFGGRAADFPTLSKEQTIVHLTEQRGG